MKSMSLAIVLTIGAALVGLAQTPAGAIGPTLAKRVDPEYSSLAFRQRIEGTESLELVVSRDGSVADVRITKSIDPSGGLDNEAIRAVRQWRYVPGRVNGQPVPTLVSVDIPFRLPNRAPVAGDPPSTEAETVFARGTADARTRGFVAPAVTYELHPSYTEDATHEKIQGDVGLQLLVSADGSVTKVRIVRSADSRFGLDQQAVNAARLWKFTPATIDGRPVAALVDIVISFRLH